MEADTLTAADGLRLKTRLVRPATGPARALVVVVHGLGDHLEALPYRTLAAALAERGLATFRFDLRGHGRSEGPRMFVENWPVLMDDLGRVMAAARATEPHAPLFLLGLSLGGLIALRYAQTQPAGLRGLILLAPAVSAAGAPPLIRVLMPVLGRLLPRLALDPRLDRAGIARDPAAVAEYTGDPLFQVKTTARLAAEMLAAMPPALAAAPHMQMPLLILHGAADTIVPPAGSAAFFERADSADKTRKTYPGGYHNLLIDSNRAEVLADLCAWVERHP